MTNVRLTLSPRLCENFARILREIGRERRECSENTTGPSGSSGPSGLSVPSESTERTGSVIHWQCSSMAAMAIQYSFYVRYFFVFSL